MRLRHLLLGSALVLALGTQARALPFSAGDLIVTTDNEIVELASLSSEVVDRLALAGRQQPCFLPNGNLLVVGGAGLLEIAPGGDVVREIDVPISDIAISHVLVGPNGDVYVQAEFLLLKIDLDTGNVESSIELAGRQQPCFLPNGNLLVPLTSVPGNQGAGSVGVLLEVDPGNGEVLRAVTIDGISEITGAAPGPDGLLILTTTQEILLVDPVSGTIADRLAFAGRQQPCFFPDGNLLVLDEATGALELIDLASRQIVATPLPSGARGFTLVPYRFRVNIRGTLADSDQLANLAERGELMLSPGMRRIALVPDAGGDLVALFDASALVLFGFEAPDARSRRLFHGSQVPASDSGAPLASLVLQAVGKLGGGFVPASAQGTLHVAGGQGIFSGRVTTGRLLNR